MVGRLIITSLQIYCRACFERILTITQHLAKLWGKVDYLKSVCARALSCRKMYNTWPTLAFSTDGCDGDDKSNGEDWCQSTYVSAWPHEQTEAT